MLEEKCMGGGCKSSLLVVLLAAMISLSPMSAAGQGQTQTLSPSPQAHRYEPISNARALCPEESRNNVGKTKDRLLALPANVVEPQKTPDGWPDLQGSWSSDAYPASARH